MSPPELDDIVFNYLIRTAERLNNAADAARALTPDPLPVSGEDVKTEVSTPSDTISTTHDIANKVKEYIIDDRHRIKLHDLVNTEISRIRSIVEDRMRFPLNGSFSSEQLDDRMRELEAESSRLVAMFAVAGYWLSRDQTKLWIEGLQALSNYPDPREDRVMVAFESIRRYPALLAVYAYGVAAVAAGRLTTLGSILTRPQVRDRYRNQTVPFVVAVNTSEVLSPTFQQRLPGKARNRAPFSERLWGEVGLGDALSNLIPDPERFTAAFDRFEYLAAMIEQDLHGWAPSGCFVWRGMNMLGDPSQSSTANRVAQELEEEGQAWDLINSDAFENDLQRAIRAKAAVDKRFGF